MIEDIIIPLALLGIPVGIIAYLILGRKKEIGFKDFKAEPFENITKRQFQDKINLLGNKIRKGTLLIGFHKIPLIDRYWVTRGKFPIFEYDEQKNIAKDTGKTEEYDFLIFRAKSSHLLLRLLGLGRQYFILDNKITTKNIKFFPDKNTWKLPDGIDFDNYGNIWIDGGTQGEYINNLAFMRMNENNMTHVVNYPNKVVHLEMEQAKKERLALKNMELDKSRYEEVKRSSDTTIT